MTGVKNRSSYALMLIKMEERRNGMSALWNHFGKNAISERIEAIMKFKKTSIWACILALALIAGATTAFAAARTDDNMELMGLGFSTAEVGDMEAVEIGNTTLVQRVGEEGNQADNRVTNIEDMAHMDVNGTTQNAQSMDITLVSVSHDDESKFTPEEWAEILKQIEQGTVHWED